MDAALDMVGMGLWQLPPILTLALIQAFAAIGFTCTVFVNPNLYCTSDYNSTVLNDIDVIIKNSTLISNEESTKAEYNVTSLKSSNDDNVLCHQSHNIVYLMYYDISIFIEVWSARESTLASDFSIYGDRAWLSSFYQMGFVFGVMIGYFAGNLSDTYGRVPIIRYGTIGCIIGQLAIPFSPYLSIIIFCRILTGVTYSMINTSAYNLVMETTPTKYRVMVSTLIGLPYIISAILLSISAYFIRNWRLLHFCNSIYVFILLISVMFLKKSPYWLLQNDCVKDAEEVIILGYECNKRKSPPYNLCVFENSTETTEKAINENESTIIGKAYSLFKTKKMRNISILHPILFSFIGFIYFGIPLNANNFTDSPYVYIFLIESVEILPSILGTLVVKKLGNINSITLLSIIPGICMLSMIFLNYWILNWVLVAVANMAVSLAYLIYWTLSSQLFPTSLRSTGFGISSFTCHFGNLIASYIFGTIASNFPLLPNLISGILCFSSAILVQLLPETSGEPLCENISDIELRVTKPNRLSCQTKKSNQEAKV